MSASKDTKRGTWKVYIRYKDRQGVGQVHTKRGFAIKREALEYEREFLLKKSKNINMGFNYSNENPGAPWSNMALMMLVCTAMGIIFSYVTLKTGNCMYAAIMHGVVNIIGEIPVFCSVSLKSGLLGPNPTGLLSMTFLIILAILMYFKLEKGKHIDS